MGPTFGLERSAASGSASLLLLVRGSSIDGDSTIKRVRDAGRLAVASNETVTLQLDLRAAAVRPLGTGVAVDRSLGCIDVRRVLDTRLLDAGRVALSTLLQSLLERELALDGPTDAGVAEVMGDMLCGARGFDIARTRSLSAQRAG